MSRGGTVAGPPGMSQSRMKPENAVWQHGGGGGGGGGGGRNSSWDEIGNQPVGGGGWDEPGSWAKQKMPGPLWDNELDWSHKQGNKPQLTKEMVWNSKQFRMLVDMGHKVSNNSVKLRFTQLDEFLFCCVNA